MKKCYQFLKEADQNVLEVYGDITSIKWFEDDVTAFDFAHELSELQGPLLVRINSYGGEVSQGLAIYNLLKDYEGEVTTICDGFACSCASIIFMAGAKRIMPKASLLMIHNAWTTAQGNSDELRKIAEDLEKITQPSIEIYKATTGLTEEVVKQMMDDETWITADEGLELGFATEVTEVEAKQSLEDSFLSKAIMKTKQLEKQLAVLPAQETIPAKCGWGDYFNN